jgi:MFS family permease
MFSRLPRKLQFVICFVVSTAALACMGPSSLLGLSDNLFPLVLVGWFVLTFMQAACFIPSLPEALESYQVKHRIIPGIDAALDGKLNDIMSSGYGFFYNLSSMAGPVIGGALFSDYGFVETLDVNMIFSAVVATIFIIFNCGT